MAESSNPTQIPSPPDVTSKEDPVTLDRPESPNPFLHADQVEFNFDRITFTSNNEVALLYPEHQNSKYFQIVSDFISKCCLKEASLELQTNTKNNFLNSGLLNNGILGEVMLKGAHFGALMKSSRKSTDLTANTPYYSRPIRHIQDFDKLKDHFLTLKNTLYLHQRYAVYNIWSTKKNKQVFT
ncbi:hypothetical protein Tco_1264967 [Tanacetum coccineum]